ncbi:hypothetical protein VMCG_03075 [Cytospora schulzeri]|uniref:Heterokaryon incompatibility domain-containing protein n=1 Tax=Cytospora schulzeri TaxID=448051 RepID=A0A423WXY4_9PEZI|nr:hypothetical protein VMCG_03075 [Valsa malicola]
MANFSSGTSSHHNQYYIPQRTAQIPNRNSSSDEIHQDEPVQLSLSSSQHPLGPSPPLTTEATRDDATKQYTEKPTDRGTHYAGWSWLIPWPRSAPDKIRENLEKRFRGQWAFHHTRRVFWPRPPANADPEALSHGYHTEAGQDWGNGPRGGVVRTGDGKLEYRNELDQVVAKYRDTAVYLSPTHALPRRLVVQATGTVLRDAESGDDSAAETGDWIRTHIRGNVPAVLKMSEWALGPLGTGRWWDKVDGFLRMLLVSVPLQVMMALPSNSDWEDSDIADSYTDFPGYYWYWPKYATNVLDEAPGPNGLPKRISSHPSDVRGRSTRPHKIVMRVGGDDDNRWEVVDAKDHLSVRYVFISYQWTSFESDEEQVKRMARQIAKKKGYRAYWLDIQCNHQQDGPKRDYDVYTMCDVVRGSGLVAILLSNDTNKARRGWGSRLWTLPEGLLAPGDSVVWCYETTPGVLYHEEVYKIEMTSTFWGQRSNNNNNNNQDEVMTEYEGGSPLRVLAEHYSSLLTLSRLELLPTIISALAAMEWNNKAHSHSDLAYAVMGFLHYRLERNEDDTLFQSLARLSLSNDSDRIIERMISILPQAQRPPLLRPTSGSITNNPMAVNRKDVLDNSDLFRDLALADKFGTRIHDITPLCDVVGVAHEDDTVIVDNCKAIHIRWKNFPRPEVQRHRGFKKMVAGVFVAAGLWWLTWGVNVTVIWLPVWAGWAGEEVKTAYIAWLAGGFFLVAVVLSAAAPLSVRRLFGGKVERSSPYLVAFEGVMPIAALETIIFGNSNSRLTYAPSSTPFCALPGARHKRERQGIEPPWVKNPERMREDLRGCVPPGHHLFTLVDTGDLTVSILSAERPPTVALLCGKEGGMVRAVLCSWRFENDCLYKETVVRMPSTVYESATPKDWLKLCLQTQNQARRKREGLAMLKQRDGA